MKIYIVRHGDKEKYECFNEQLRHHDPPLSKKGHEQAWALVEFFKTKSLKRIIASEFLRAYQTAYYVAMDKGLPIAQDRRLNENDNGLIDRMTDEEIQERFPEFWSDYQRHDKDVRFPEGETGEEVKIRQKNLLVELLSKNEDVLLVSHDGYIRLLLCHLLDVPVYRRHLLRMDTCGIMEFEWNSKTGEWRINRFNQIFDQA